MSSRMRAADARVGFWLGRWSGLLSRTKRVQRKTKNMNGRYGVAVLINYLFPKIHFPKLYTVRTMPSLGLAISCKLSIANSPFLAMIKGHSLNFSI